jgi:STE24 endopeptidase
MVPLQTAPPRAGPAVAAFLGFVLLGAIVGAAGSALVRRLSKPVGKYRLLYAVVLFPVTILAYGLLTLLGFGPALVGSVPAPDVLGALLADFVEFLAAGLVWLAAYAPTVRGVREVRDIELSTRSSLARMARYVLGLSAVAAVMIAPLQFVPPGASPFVLAVALAPVGVVVLYLSPWIVPLLRASHEPIGGTSERIEAIRTRAGLDVRDALVLDTDDEETADSLVRGPPGYRRLFVTSTFLDAFDDETATGLLAIEAGRLRSNVFEIRVSTVLVAGVALVASVSGAGPRWPTLGLSVGALVVGFWASRRGIRAADEYAAGRVGASTVAEALARYAESHAMEPSRRRLPNPLSVNVALGDRIDRLDRSGRDAAT